MVFKRFANGLQEDYDAVKWGIALAWSNGPEEGQINRLKMLKRQMYGRVGIGLLKQRVLNSTRSTRSRQVLLESASDSEQSRKVSKSQVENGK
jgi:hypothetical protein